MKFSLKIAQYYNEKYQSSVDPFSHGVDEIISRIGLRLGAVEDVIKFAEKYEGVVVAKVITCIKHPNADKLSLCTVDDGGVVPGVDRDENGYVQVVCGAPNVAEGLIVAWIPPGATVPSTRAKDPFVLDARELRGKISNGMIASPKELDLSDDHEGILEISAEDVGDNLSQPGTEFSKLYGLDDVIIDCENKMFTHRPDCFGNIGIAREIAGIFGDSYKSPNWYLNAENFEVTNTLQLDIDDKILDKVPRFTVRAIADVEIKNSPMWLQTYLKRIGSNSINNIVDYTNYYMMLTGQPLHAFDYDKVKKLSGDSVFVEPRMAIKGEKLNLLNGKTIELSEDDIVIATDTQPIALGGVMGGADTEVDANTKNIILECANFDMYTIRRTSMRHGLFTDAVTRFNKGQSPLQNDKVLAKITGEIVEFAKGRVASELLDVASFDLNSDNLNHVSTTVGFINSRLGSELNVTEIKELLENVEFIVSVQGDALEVTAPFWRMDIAIAEDIVEEVGRLYGYDNIPVILPKRTTKPAKVNKNREFNNHLRQLLARAGANEVLTYSFVHGKLLENVGIDPEKWAYHLRNALSPDLQYYRPSLVPSLLAKVRSNIKAQAGNDQNIFALFEIGKAHVKDHFEDDEPELPKQLRRISFVVVADDKSAKYLGESAYYLAKKYVKLLTGNEVEFSELDSNEYPITAPYEKLRSAIITLGNGDATIGVVGEFSNKVKKSLKLPEYCAGFEIDLDLLQLNVSAKKYIKLSQFPSVSQDVTYEVPSGTLYSTVKSFLDAELQVAHAESGYLSELIPLDIYKENKNSKKRFSFRITVTHPDKTLKTNEVTKLLDEITESIGEKLQTTRI